MIKQTNMADYAGVLLGMVEPKKDDPSEKIMHILEIHNHTMNNLATAIKNLQERVNELEARHEN